jgi:hypothetical protein
MERRENESESDYKVERASHFPDVSEVADCNWCRSSTVKAVDEESEILS